MPDESENAAPVAALFQQALSAHQQGQLSHARSLYQKILEFDPNHSDSFHLLGVIAIQQDDVSEAVRLIERALEANPGNAAAHSNRGVALQRLKRFDEALASFDAAIALAPGYSEAHYNRGLTLHALKRPREALEGYDAALRLKPDYAEAHGGRGIALGELGQLDASLENLDRAIALKANYPEAWNNRGKTLQRLRRPDAALESFTRAAETNPGYAEAFYNRGLVLHDLGRLDEALASYDRAVAVDPRSAGAWSSRGAILVSLDRPGEALESCDRAVALAPDSPEGWNNRAVALQELHRHAEAIESCDRSLALNPNYTEAWSNRGIALYDLGRAPEALESYDRAIAADPGYPQAHSNRGLLLHDLGRLDEARASFLTALEIRPGYADVRWNLSLLDLLAGNFAEGWKGYEARAQASAARFERRSFTQPLWLGDDTLAGKAILLHAEQGLGDTLQFCRYAKQVADMGAKVVLEAQRPLVPLLRTLGGVSKVLAKGDPLPAFDVHCPLASLPFAFKTGIDTIPSRKRYLRADAGKVAAWTERLGYRTKPRVGLAWSGSTTHRNDRNRSIPLDLMLRALPRRFQYIALQKELREADAKTLAARKDLLFFGDQLDDFTDTAALCTVMDLVVTVDTSIAHLAGALGKETWILLPYVPDFRWLLDREDSPWYPTVKLYRQTEIGDWNGVLERVKRDLNARAAAGGRE